MISPKTLSKSFKQVGKSSLKYSQKMLIIRKDGIKKRYSRTISIKIAFPQRTQFKNYQIKFTYFEWKIERTTKALMGYRNSTRKYWGCWYTNIA